MDSFEQVDKDSQKETDIKKDESPMLTPLNNKSKLE